MALFGFLGRKRTSNAWRQLVRERERLAALEIGGSKERPIPVGSASVVEARARRLACPQCAGEYRVVEHRAAGPAIRQVLVTCRQCAVSRSLWFRLSSNEAS